MPIPEAASVLDCGMEIGDLVIYKGRAYVLRGLEPMSVPNRRAELEDPESGARLSAPFDEVSDPPAAGDSTQDP
jgi:hypothetical protein